MKDIRSVKNQYLGINAHLHSWLQGQKLWGDFHTRHIAYLANAFNAQLQLMGYVAAIEQSLQIRRLEGGSRRPRADVLIFDRDPVRPMLPSTPSTGIQTIPLIELVDDDVSEKPYRAIAIYELDEVTRERGEPVVWIELLSPTNKGSGEDADTYRLKRMDLMLSGLVFVEIDYLHETPPTFHTIPSYQPNDGQQRHLDAQPYHILVINPRPQFEKGVAQVAGFGVDVPIVTLDIPLNAGEALNFDFGIPYHKTFEEGFLGDQVDYSVLPMNFERYSPSDQSRIAARMLSVLEAHQQGVDLETGFFTTKEIKLDEALAAIEQLKSSD